MRGRRSTLTSVLCEEDNSGAVVVVRGGERAVLVALEGDDAGLVALLGVALVEDLLLGAELLGPVAPDAADADIDGAGDQRDDDEAEQDAGHRPSLVQTARSSRVAARSAARPSLGNWKSPRLGSISLV